MKAISVRQPWAWLICNGHKPIENRNWRTHFRGRVLIHASQKLDYQAATDTISKVYDGLFELPPKEEIQTGGIVGAVDIVDCIENSDSPWFFGKFGFVLKNAEAVPFLPLKGKLGFFEVNFLSHEQEGNY